MDNMKKHVEHKDTLKMMNDALKRQVDLVKEECELRIKVSKSYCKKKFICTHFPLCLTMTMMYVLGRGVQEAGEPQWVQRHHGRAVGAAGGAVRQQRQGEL